MTETRLFIRFHSVVPENCFSRRENFPNFLNKILCFSFNSCLRKGVVATPRFFKTAFLPNKLHQTLLCNNFYTLYASLYVYEVKFGGVVWVWGSSKKMVEGFGEILWILFCPLLKYDENHHFISYSANNPAKIWCFYDFLTTNWLLLIFTYIFNASKFPRAGWLYDVTVTSHEVQWYSFWYQ